MIPIDIGAIDTRLRGGKLWTRGWGTPDDPNKPTCLHGAIRYCQPVPGDAYLIEQVGARYGWGINDNDGADSWESLRAKVPPSVTNEMLARTFGPQWGCIVALVRRAVLLTLTPSESDTLLTAIDDGGTALSVWDVAWGAAQGAAQGADRNGEWERSREVVRASTTGLGEPWVVAAAWALVVRDLIGQHGFTQEHYDALTRPWRTVIGPLHPDDEQGE